MDNTLTILETIASGTDAHIYVKDENCHFVYCNEAVARTLRSTPEEMIGKADIDYVDEAAAYPFREADLRVLSSGEPEILKTEISVYGRKLAYEDHKFPVTLPNGRKGVAGIAFRRNVN